MVNIDINLQEFSQLQIAAVSLEPSLTRPVLPVPPRIHIKDVVNKPTCPRSAPTGRLDVMIFGVIHWSLW